MCDGDLFLPRNQWLVHRFGSKTEIIDISLLNFNEARSPLSHGRVLHEPLLRGPSPLHHGIGLNVLMSHHGLGLNVLMSYHGIGLNV